MSKMTYYHKLLEDGTRNPVYTMWINMKARCYNITCEQYPNYGARGIKVCDAWVNNSVAFIKWALSNGYRNDLTIDRINLDGNYKPDNCRFATPQQQADNRRPRKDSHWFKATNKKSGIELYYHEQVAFAKDYGLCQGNIGKCLHGERKSCGGWVFTWVKGERK